MLTFNIGEKREVGFNFASNTNLDFTISSATYSILDSQNNVVSQGNATINSNKVITLFNAIDSGVFHINFTVKIDDETYCPQTIVYVT